MTRTPLSRSKVQGHRAALVTAVLTRQAAAAVSVGMYWPWEPTAKLPSAGAVGSAARGASTPTEGGEGRGHIVAADRLQLVLVLLQILLMLLLLGFVLYLSTVLEPFPGRTTFPKLLQVYSFPKEFLFAFSALTL